MSTGHPNLRLIGVLLGLSLLQLVNTLPISTDQVQNPLLDHGRPTNFNPFTTQAKGPVTPTLRDLHFSGQPVLFEPMPSIEISRSTFTVTSVLSFHPVIEQFESLSQYLLDFFTDLMRPQRLTTLRTGQTLPRFITAGNTHVRVRGPDNQLPAVAENPWCNDTFSRRPGQTTDDAETISDVKTLHECNQVCLSEPTCEYYTFYVRTCRMGFRGHKSAYQTSEFRQTRVTGALYLREHCEEKIFRNMTLDQIIQQKEITCRNFQCEAVRQYLDLLSELKYVRDVYNTMYGSFLSAIGRSYYFTTTAHIIRANASEGTPHTNNPALQDSEDAALQALLSATQSLLDKHRQVNGTRDRSKRFSVTDFFFGWGMGSYTSYRNARALEAINHNVNLLQEQNELQEQQIQELASNLELTMEHVNLNQEAIRNLDERLLQAEYAMSQIKEQLEYLRLVWSMTSSTRTAINRVQSALHAMRTNTDYIFRVIETMATRKITPTVIPRVKLLNILQAVRRHLGTQPRLSLPHDPESNIWQYYDLIRVTPIMTSDMVIMMLSFPLTDKALDLEVYKVHRLPALHPELKEEFTYRLEGDYLGITADGDFSALITHEEIQLCQSTDDYLCTLNSALYPTDSLGWCVYQLFVHNEEKIAQHCEIEHTPHHTPKVISLGGYAWAVSSLITSRVDIQCYAQEHRVNIEPPLTIIYVANGCHAYSSQFKIPAKTDLTTMQEFFPREEFLTLFNAHYQSYDDYHLWAALDIKELTPEEVDQMRIHLPTLGSMTTEHLRKHIKPINKVNIWVPKAWQVAIGMILGFIFVAIVIFLLVMWVKDKYQDLAKYKAGFAASALSLTGNIVRQAVASDPKSLPSSPTTARRRWTRLFRWGRRTPPAPPTVPGPTRPSPPSSQAARPPLPVHTSPPSAGPSRTGPLPLPPPPAVADYDNISLDDKEDPTVPSITKDQIAGAAAHLIRKGHLPSLRRKVQEHLAQTPF